MFYASIQINEYRFKLRTQALCQCAQMMFYFYLTIYASEKLNISFDLVFLALLNSKIKTNYIQIKSYVFPGKGGGMKRNNLNNK